MPPSRAIARVAGAESAPKLIARSPTSRLRVGRCRKTTSGIARLPRTSTWSRSVAQRGSGSSPRSPAKVRSLRRFRSRGGACSSMLGYAAAYCSIQRCPCRQVGATTKLTGPSASSSARSSGSSLAGEWMSSSPPPRRTTFMRRPTSRPAKRSGVSWTQSPCPSSRSALTRTWLRSQELREGARRPIGRLELRVVRDVVERVDLVRAEALAQTLGHVRAGDGIEHAPDEQPRHVGALQRIDPAALVLEAVVDVADQPVVATAAAVACDAQPVLVELGVRRHVLAREDPAQPGGEALLVHARGDERADQRLAQRLLDLQRAVQVRVEAAVQERDP